MADRVNTPTAREADTEAQPETADGAASKAGSGGIKAWIPLLATVVAMPALAYATTQFLLLPKIKAALAQNGAAAAAAAAPADASKEGAAGGKEKVLAPLPGPKLVVNLAGSMMTRYLAMSITLVGNTSDFKEVVNRNTDQLRDLAIGVLMSKTIPDLEKPGSRNQIRSELLTVFNNGLGGSVVQDLYITDLAVQ